MHAQFHFYFLCIDLADSVSIVRAHQVAPSAWIPKSSYSGRGVNLGWSGRLCCMFNVHGIGVSVTMRCWLTLCNMQCVGSCVVKCQQLGQGHGTGQCSGISCASLLWWVVRVTWVCRNKPGSSAPTTAKADFLEKWLGVLLQWCHMGGFKLAYSLSLMTLSFWFPTSITNRPLRGPLAASLQTNKDG